MPAVRDVFGNQRPRACDPDPTNVTCARAAADGLDADGAGAGIAVEDARARQLAAPAR